ncbi:hypothetical protein AB0L13_32820 [Saccharopolyspora shandongensis]|uniref:hypothetical protein n=1 Tax=Saccharopolyspora shandongensis TaxID=418495 RepID=UPI003425F0B8
MAQGKHVLPVGCWRITSLTRQCLVRWTSTRLRRCSRSSARRRWRRRCGGTGCRVRHSTTLNPGNAIGIAVLTAVAYAGRAVLFAFALPRKEIR